MSAGLFGDQRKPVLPVASGDLVSDLIDASGEVISSAAPPVARRIGMPTLAGCGAILLWSIFAPVARFAADLPPFEMTAIGFAIAFAAGMAMLIWRGRLGELRQPPVAWLHGVGGLFGYYGLYLLAMTLAPPNQVVAIGYIWPVLTVLTAPLILGLSLKPRHLLAVLLGALGCCLLLGHAGPLTTVNLPGYGLALASALIWALYSNFSGRLTNVPTGAMTGFFGVIAILSLAIHRMLEVTILPGVGASAAVLLLGLGPMGLAFFLWDYGTKHGDPRLLATLGYGTSIISYGLLSALGFATFTPVAALAAALVCLGGFVAARA